MLSNLLKVTQLRRLYALAPEATRLPPHIRGAGRGWGRGGAEGAQALSPPGALGGRAPPAAVGGDAAVAFAGPAGLSDLLSPHSTEAEAEAQRR